MPRWIPPERLKTVTDITCGSDWAKRNPFTDTYVREEAANYATDEAQDQGGVTIKNVTPNGCLMDFLNKNFYTGKLSFPAFYIDGRCWMSMSRMELQSNHVPVQFAQDRVATLGLGMGAFTLRAMALDHVESIDVYEQDPRVIKLFQRFSDRLGFEKVSFILGDARELCRGKEYDYLYTDIYPTLLGDEVVDDLEQLLDQNDIGTIHFWGRERIVLDAVRHDLLPLDEVDFPTALFLHTWQTTPISDTDDRLADTTLDQLAHHPIDVDFVERILEIFNDRDLTI